MEKKLTKIQKIEMLLTIGEVQKNKELVEFLENEKTLLIKKAEKAKTSKIKVENNAIKTVILEEMEIFAIEPIAMSALLKNSVKINELVAGSGQKLTALLTQMVAEGKIYKKDKKGKDPCKYSVNAILE